ncbi:extracellular solute-binding protein [Rubellicoccus peritrichatus]|uniref:Extracellular solute-binding protein n=1 Tax=Rubellicoccus peritrichatus TaxID=3080537 RepID=A0AAQ3QXG1_9BACT|nr:extracellular solute-binding protein [Puniceicoccus sp. CR14]WOO43037.1 extracellular solute-binding protein [Puniceicoccus sp. CR14]
MATQKKIWVFIPLLITLLFGCGPKDNNGESNRVVVYTSWDQPHSRPILQKFEEQTGIKVDAVYDAEASKTAGLVNRLIAEKNNPRADVFWNSEIVRTLVLKEKEVLAPYKPPAWEETPSSFRDPEGYWTGFAGRARVLIYNTDLITNPPTELKALTESEWKGRATIANPLFGTTSTEVATWFSLWGSEKAEGFLMALKNNDVIISTGNATAKDAVASGEVPIGLTDTDDAWGAMQNNKPVDMVFLDQAGEGALLIPNTVCLIKGAPNETNAKKLIDFLTSREVSEMLANSRAGQIPLKKDIPAPSHVEAWASKKFKQVDFEAAYKELDPAMQFVRDEFLEAR